MTIFDEYEKNLKAADDNKKEAAYSMAYAETVGDFKNCADTIKDCGTAMQFADALAKKIVEFSKISFEDARLIFPSYMQDFGKDYTVKQHYSTQNDKEYLVLENNDDDSLMVIGNLVSYDEESDTKTYALYDYDYYHLSCIAEENPNEDVALVKGLIDDFVNQKYKIRNLSWTSYAKRYGIKTQEFYYEVPTEEEEYYHEKYAAKNAKKYLTDLRSKTRKRTRNDFRIKRCEALKREKNKSKNNKKNQ